MKSSPPRKSMSLFLLLGFLLLPWTTKAGSTPFSDVPEDHRYAPAIDFVESEGIVDGYDDGTYKPYQTVNRAELLKIIVEAVYENEFQSYSEQHCFEDVPAGKWYTSYVCFAKSEGIVKGYEDGTFRPNEVIRLVEALKINLIAFGQPIDESLDPWYRDIVNQASDHHLIPLEFDYFEDPVDRGQMAELITRTLKAASGELNTYLAETQRENFQVTYETIENHSDLEMARDFILLVNAHREANGVHPLIVAPELNQVARDHSKWQYDNQTMSHTGENGTNPFERCELAGTTCSGENVAMNSYATAERFFEGLKASPPHNENMLREAFTETGIGINILYLTNLFR